MNMVEKSGDPDKKSNNAITKAFSAITDIAKAAMDGASTTQKMVIGISAFFSLVLIVIAFREPYLALPALGMVIIFFIYVLHVTIPIIKDSNSETGTLLWKRQVIKKNESPSQLKSLGDHVEMIRKKALSILQQQVSDVRDQDIRANVFVPDYWNSREGLAFKLWMPKELCKNMVRPQELNVRFSPGEGATGYVFLHGTNRITYSKDFLITEENRDAIHPDLKWFVSLPLSSTQGAPDNITLAVLNIDGLIHEIEEEKLRSMIGSISNEVSDLAKLLSMQPMTTLSLFQQD